jgi:hypothetical protein
MSRFGRSSRFTTFRERAAADASLTELRAAQRPLQGFAATYFSRGYCSSRPCGAAPRQASAQSRSVRSSVVVGGTLMLTSNCPSSASDSGSIFAKFSRAGRGSKLLILSNGAEPDAEGYDCSMFYGGDGRGYTEHAGLEDY